MGQKHYFPKRLACRNDYCTHCQQPTFTEKYRYLVVLTKFAIPVFPVGLGSSWSCTTCGQSPREAAPDHKLALVIGTAVGFVLSCVAFQLPFPEEDVGTKWGLGIILVVFTLILGIRLMTQDRKGYLANLAGVVPIDKNHCPYCSADLLGGTTARCYQCKVDVM